MPPAVFLDRDGTIIIDRHYLGDPAGVELCTGAAEAIARLNLLHLPVILVTNQSGIGRGMFTEPDFWAVQDRLSELLTERGAHIDHVYFCPHAPENQPACDCRKPATGLFLRAAEERGVNVKNAFFVGDRLRDVLPGLTLGGKGILVDSSDASEGARAPAGIHRVDSLFRAVELIESSVPFD